MDARVSREATRGRRRRRLPSPLSVAPLLVLLFFHAPARAGRDRPPSPDPPGVGTEQTIPFHRELANIEYFAEFLAERPPDDLSRAPTTAEPLWFGKIPYREPGASRDAPARFIAFAAAYRGGAAGQAWVDENRNGDLGDDAAVTLLQYPGLAGARSFLLDVTWPDPGGSASGVTEKIRVVLDSVAVDSVAPTFRAQRVFAPVGEVTLAGRPHRAVLFDGNWDGRYALEFGDGIFVDWNDDRNLDTDLMSPEFGPFRVPFTMAGRRLEATAVDPAGGSVTLRDLGPAPPEPALAVGETAPDFDFQDERGAPRSLRAARGEPAVVYFCASWCATCAYQTPQLIDLYERYHRSGLSLIAVSYDTDPASVREYRERYAPPWPILYTGHAFWENPVGRLYQARGAGMMFLVDRDGRLDGRYTSVPELRARLATMLR